MGDLELVTTRDILNRTGRYEPALLMFDRIAADDHDRRHLFASVLAKAAIDVPAWWLAWSQERPDDPQRLVIEARRLVDAAWKARGGAWAKHTSREAFAEFHRILPLAETACALACEAAPDDPSPWITRLWISIGRGAPREVFEARWDALLERDPHSRFGHNAALQYLAEKWYGSHEEMYAFARERAAQAPHGSPLKLLVLQAHVEYHLRSNAGEEEFDIDAFWLHPERQADIDAALASYPDRTKGRNATWLHDASILTFALAMSDRWLDLAVQFAGTANTVYEYPWYYTNSRFLQEAYENSQEAIAG